MLWLKQQPLTWHGTLSLDGCHYFRPTQPPLLLLPLLLSWLSEYRLRWLPLLEPPWTQQPSPPPPPFCWVIRGPSAQHKDTAARLSTRGAQDRAGAPTDSYSAPVNDVIEIPIRTGCMCAGKRAHTCPLSMQPRKVKIGRVCVGRREGRGGGGGGAEECVDATYCAFASFILLFFNVRIKHIR